MGPDVMPGPISTLLVRDGYLTVKVACSSPVLS